MNVMVKKSPIINLITSEIFCTDNLLISAEIKIEKDSITNKKIPNIPKIMPDQIAAFQRLIW